MFSWGKGSTTTTYPVQRTAANVTGSPAFQAPPRVATAINLGFSRQQHLQSLLNDSKLAPSTRKASNGESFSFLLEKPPWNESPLNCCNFRLQMTLLMTLYSAPKAEKLFY